MIRRRRAVVESKVNRDRWLVSYADFITLLFGFFVVMYSVSQVNETAYRELAQTLGATFDARAQSPTTEAPVSLARPHELAAQIEAALADWVDVYHAEIAATDQWVEVSVDADLLFASGSAEPSAQARSVFENLAALLAPYQNAVEVAGHTDNLPIANSEFTSNWELSAARAIAVVALLQQQGVEPHRMAAIGYGEFQPLADNTTEEGRAKNRRVVLQVARHQAERPVAPVQSLRGMLNDPAQPAEQASAVSAPDPPTVRRDEKSAGADEQANGGEAAAQSESDAGDLLRPIVREDGSLLFTTDPKKRREHDVSSSSAPTANETR